MWDKSHHFVTKPYGLGSLNRTNLLGVGLRCKAKNGEDFDTSHHFFKTNLFLFSPNLTRSETLSL